MGNCFSRPDADTTPARRAHQGKGAVAVGAPQEVMAQVPRNRVDRYGVPVQQVSRDIEKDTLLAALKHVAKYIARHGQSITVIAVGGVVNTLYLESRRTTHDVAIFGVNFDSQTRMLLDEAMNDAQRHYRGLGTDWLNTETGMWMPDPIHQQLTSAAMTQNIKVFEMPGLTIYAAPWSYAFSIKVSRLLTGGDQARPYDLDDAVTYLHEHIRNHGDQPVRMSAAVGWAKNFRLESTPDLLCTRVNAAYRRQYGSDAFV
ncbi:hypothetical protein NLG97_g2253 [Lecanicillium saksenae]|uniref:Uncharacterized protein n=1 Tax=Lecanicillium saksenae TaxID=468837 RepID=A0ACC1R2V1_9HYPO|nr:hypothetical protein NLG97_g2253 [Lecanicillium saksenae]